MLMLKSRELRTQRAKLIEDMRTELKADVTAEIRAKVEKIEKDITDLDANIALYERQEERERLLAVEKGTKIEGSDDNTPEQRKKQIEEESRKYSDAFWAYMRSGEASLSAEQRATLRSGYRSVTETEQRAQTITTTGGGYVIPQGFMAELERALKLYGGVRQVARTITTGAGNPMPWPTIDDTGNTGEDSTINTNISGQDMTFGSVTLSAYKMDSGLILIPNELFEDSGISLDAEISSLLGERLGRRQNNKQTLGSGSSTFQGVTVGASAGITSASPTAIAADELFDLETAVDPAYRNDAFNCGFMMNDLTRKALRKLKDAQGHYLWDDSLSSKGPATLLGYPVTINQDMAGIAATNISMLFGAFRKFIIRDVRNVVVRRLNELYAQADQVGFLAFYRGDSRVVSASSKALVTFTQHA